ncbi:MAG: DUF2520 domain-containing protein [Ignavibacterium sp.]
MRQVPKQDLSDSFLIIGNGKLSKHFQRYFTLKEISFNLYTKNSNTQLKELIKAANKILILVNDDSLEKVIQELASQISEHQILIHCSGMLSTNLAESAHPLMTFSENLYDLDVYEKIPFITERNRKSFKELFPKLNNPSFEIDPDDKILYHAYCVMSGNFTTILWNKFFYFLESRKIPKTAAIEYLKMTSHNLIHLDKPLTGPLARNDLKVIEKHLKSLSGNSMQKVYLAMIDVYKDIEKEEKIEINK